MRGRFLVARGSPCRWCEPVACAIDCLLSECSTRRLDAPAAIRERESRPLRQIMNHRRPAACEKPTRELRQRRVAGERLGGRHPLIEQRIGELLAAPGPAADEPLQLCPHQEVHHADLVSRDPAPLEDRAELIARQVLARLARLLQLGTAAPDRRPCDSPITVTRCPFSASRLISISLSPPSLPATCSALGRPRTSMSVEGPGLAWKTAPDRLAAAIASRRGRFRNPVKDTRRPLRLLTTPLWICLGGLLSASIISPAD